MTRGYHYTYILLLILLASCSRKSVPPTIEKEPNPIHLSDRLESTDKAVPKKVVLRRADSLSLLLDTDPVLSQHFTGLHIYDLKAKEEVYAHNADRYFTPASNIKLYTLLASLRILGNSMSTISYCSAGNDLIVRGCGDPSFLTHRYDGKDVIELLQKTKGRIYYDDSHFMDKRFGNGWAWDDYPYYYQKEMSALPLYGNGLLTEIIRPGNQISTYPKHLEKLVVHDTTATRSLSRAETENKILYNPKKNTRKRIMADIPLRMNADFSISLLSKAINKPIYKCPPSKSCKTYSNTKHRIDSLYKDLILDSDNFIGDQLLLACSHKMFDTMDTRRIIKHLQVNEFKNLPDTVRWVDGSGLSRYNLVTPRSTTWILNEIFSETSLTFIKKIFPSRSSKGTLRKEFDVPNVYVKTGSLSNNYNLSGYIKAKSGRLYSFSFMNNHFLSKTKEVDQRMQEILKYIYRRY